MKQRSNVLETKPQPYDQFLLFGDSITQESGNQLHGFGFATELQNDYLRKLDVINRGLSGYNTKKALRVLPKLLPSPDEVKIRFMTVFFGANDACLPNVGNGQNVPLEEYKTNLKKICRNPRVQAHQPRIILITPPPVDEPQMEATDARMGRILTRTADHTKIYADATRDVGRTLGVEVLDLWTAFMNIAGWEEGQPLPGRKDQPPNQLLRELLSDGLHLNPKGYRIMYEEMRLLISQKWPDQAPENLPLVFPLWNDESEWQKWN